MATSRPIGIIETVEAEDHVAERGDASDCRLRILLLCNYDVTNAATVCDHINNFVRHSRHDVTVVSKLGRLPETVDFGRFDVVVVHYSLTLALDAYVAPQTRHRLAAFRGLKVLFIQDEYRFVRDTEDAIRECGIHLVFTVLPQELVQLVYNTAALPGVRFVSTLTGYVPDWLKVYSTVPLSQRRYDLGYRGRTYPAWHGRPGIERIEIGRVFTRMARRLKLRVNIRWGERDRLYGADWLEFTRQCRAVLSTESSISVIDRDGSISNRYNAFVELLGVQQPGPGSDMRSMRLLGITDKDTYTGWFEALKRRFFANDEGRVVISVISPRVFEAAALRTLLVMYEGHYSGVVEPWRHFVPLKKDHSNIKEVAEFIKDDVRCAEMISNCFAEIACNPIFSAKAFMAQFDVTVAAEMQTHRRASGMSLSAAEVYSAVPFFYVDNPYGVVPRSMSSARFFGLMRRVRSVFATPPRLARKFLNFPRLR